MSDEQQERLKKIRRWRMMHVSVNSDPYADLSRAFGEIDFLLSVIDHPLDLASVAQPPPIDKTREVPKEGRTYGWILGSQYEERGYHDEGDKGDGGEPWYLTVDGTPWSALDVHFFPDHVFNGAPKRSATNTLRLHVSR